MERKSLRLFFIDAIRAWAILMMLQGHFVDGLLANIFRDNSNEFYSLWKYFRGITAPVFFTVSGFIFTFLLLRNDQKGLPNPRVKKGIRRGLQLIGIGYLLRINIPGLLKGQVYSSTFLVDVLHIIGLSILGVILVYILTKRFKDSVFPFVLLFLGLLIFITEPLYSKQAIVWLPDFIANYFTRANGSVFTIIPWFGYACFGGVLASIFLRHLSSKKLYPVAIIGFTSVGLLLLFKSSMFFVWLSQVSSIDVFNRISMNNYLFIRLGDVLLVFATFMLLRKLWEQRTILRIGQNTLSIYVIHFILLYGSFTGLGLYRFYNHSLPPEIVIPGALVFMAICTITALLYAKYEVPIRSNISYAIEESRVFVKQQIYQVFRYIKIVRYKLSKNKYS